MVDFWNALLEGSLGGLSEVRFLVALMLKTLGRKRTLASRSAFFLPVWEDWTSTAYPDNKMDNSMAASIWCLNCAIVLSSEFSTKTSNKRQAGKDSTCLIL